ncbi:MAG: DUF721 domain-containing protein [Actinomycetota bacterium]
MEVDKNAGTIMSRAALHRFFSTAKNRSHNFSGKRKFHLNPSRKEKISDPRVVSVELGQILTERGWDTHIAVGSVMGRWPSIVGEAIAQQCFPESFSGGVLVLRTTSTSWATQIRLLIPNILARLAEELGEETVKKIRVQPPNAPTWRHGRLTVRGRGPRDTYG